MELIKIKDADGTMILADADGNSAEFEFIDMRVLDGTEYAVLLQTGDDMVLPMRFEEKGRDGKEHYYTIDDDYIFERVYEAFREEFGDEFDFC